MTLSEWFTRNDLYMALSAGTLVPIFILMYFRKSYEEAELIIGKAVLGLVVLLFIGLVAITVYYA